MTLVAKALNNSSNSLHTYILIRLEKHQHCFYNQFEVKSDRLFFFHT